jgi:chromosome segregation ATPase
MATDPATANEPAFMGKGLFGYRRSDVEQVIADKDLMLQEAERRMRTAEARIDQLEGALAEANERTVTLEEQVGRMRAQVETLSARGAEMERVAARAQAQSDLAVAWRSRVGASIGAIAPAVERLRTLLDAVPGRVEEALAPLVHRAPALLELMHDFAKVSRPSGD